jgi:hypothetical protein
MGPIADSSISDIGFLQGTVISVRRWALFAATCLPVRLCSIAPALAMPRA